MANELGLFAGAKLFALSPLYLIVIRIPSIGNYGRLSGRDPYSLVHTASYIE